MILNVFAIYDTAAAAYLPPFFLHREEMALRAFTGCVNDPKHQFGQSPQDYTLFSLGTYDDSTGVFVNAKPAPLSIANGLAAKSQLPTQFVNDCEDDS